ncbi:MAG: 3'-5' exonuclease [Candidatus Omnitrophica bacterium]|nr:3'-5' exonuclease [Candidatus Omnitrophota bacterium]
MSVSSHWEHYPLVFVDVETTGLDPFGQDAICEIGAVKISQGVLVDTFSSLVNPKRPIPSLVSSIHSIYDEDVKGAPYFEQIVDTFMSFISGSVLAGYNVRFDLSFMNAELKKIHYPVIDLAALDVLIMARQTLKGLAHYNLSAVARHLHIKIDRAHRALDDALLTSKVYGSLQKELVKKGIATMAEYVALFGIKNEFLKKIQEPKVGFLQESIETKLTVQVRYLASDGNVTGGIIKPCGFIGEDKSVLEAIEIKTGQRLRIDVRTIISLELF